MFEEGQERQLSAQDSPTFGEDVSFYLDKPVGSASISPCGRDIVLASREGLHIIDLDSPWSPPRHLRHYTPWEVADVQWSPFAARDHWIVSTSNQKALVWNVALGAPGTAIEHTLHAHSRAVTDINFSAHHPDVLATCAVDSFVHCWDLRTPQTPSLSFCDWFAGATQVKWNRQDHHILASSHDKVLRIWDSRNGAEPLTSIKAHTTKIYGVDWDRTESTRLATCSLDKHIKIWDYHDHANGPLYDVETSFPVWRARYTPFGSALLAMPQRGDHDLHLYDRRSFGRETDPNASRTSQTVPATHRFPGHQSQVKEFLWRHRGSIDDGMDNREFQLVSWGTDRCLRLHRLDEALLEALGHEHGKPAKMRFNLTRKNARYRTFRDEPLRYDRPITNTLHAGMGSRSWTNCLQGGQTVTSLQHWPGRQRTTQKATIQHRNMQENDPIAWMRGVQIRKREPKNESLDNLDSATTINELRGRHLWASFDNLGEELTSVADKFTKVKFEKIDIKYHRIELSLLGPWGWGKSQVHLRCLVTYPDNYLGQSPPSMRLAENAMIENEYAAKLTDEAAEIFGQCARDGRPALELVLRYLLGEHDRDGIFRLIKNTSVPKSNSFPLDQYDSSDDDEDDGDIDTRGLELSDGALANSNATFNVPLPRTCGGLWANDGNLWCFLTTNEEQPQSILDAFALPGAPRVSREPSKAHASFGRLSRTSGGRHPLGSVANAADNTSSDETDDSSSSDTSDIMHFQQPRFVSPLPGRHKDESHSHQQSKGQSSGGSHWSSSGLKASQAHHLAPGSIVTIVDTHEHIPQSHQVGERYLFSAGVLECCRHNSSVAECMGDRDIAVAWLLLSLVLKDQRNSEDTRVLSQPWSVEQKHPECATVSSANQRFTGTVWGQHPFGSPWLLKSILLHFDHIADIQTLAAMLCVVSKANRDPRSSIFKNRSPQQRVTGVDGSVRTTSSTSHSSPSKQMLVKDRRATIHAPPIETEKDKKHSANYNSAASFWGERSRTLSFPKDADSALSTSFQEHQGVYHGRHSNTSLANSFTGPLPRPISSVNSVLTSPRSHDQQGTSPSGSFTHAYSTLIAKRAPSLLGKLSVTTDGSNRGTPPMPSDVRCAVIPKERRKFRSRLKNQDRFSVEGRSTDWHLRLYSHEQQEAIVYHYSAILYMWGLRDARIELLKQFLGAGQKIDCSIADADETITFSKPRGIMEGTRHFKGPQVTLYCIMCGCFAPPAPDNKCSICSSQQAPLACLLCHGIVSGFLSPCLACGHLLHLECRRLLIANHKHSGNQEQQLQDVFGCVSGCNCSCPSTTNVDIQPMPLKQREESEDTAVMDGLSGEQFLHINHGDVQSQKDPDGQAYESLARNLDKKRLVPHLSRT